MLKKRLFQVLDEMNVNDEANKTASCACCFDLVEAKTAKGGAHVVMGIPAEALHKIMLNEYKPMLVLLDMKEYNRLEAVPVVDKLQEAQQLVERYEKALKRINDTGWALGIQGCINVATKALTPKTGSDETKGASDRQG